MPRPRNSLSTAKWHKSPRRPSKPQSTAPTTLSPVFDEPITATWLRSGFLARYATNGSLSSLASRPTPSVAPQRDDAIVVARPHGPDTDRRDIRLSFRLNHCGECYWARVIAFRTSASHASVGIPYGRNFSIVPRSSLANSPRCWRSFVAAGLSRKLAESAGAHLERDPHFELAHRHAIQHSIDVVVRVAPHQRVNAPCWTVSQNFGPLLIGARRFVAVRSRS